MFSAKKCKKPEFCIFCYFTHLTPELTCFDLHTVKSLFTFFISFLFFEEFLSVTDFCKINFFVKSEKDIIFNGVLEKLIVDSLIFMVTCSWKSLGHLLKFLTFPRRAFIFSSMFALSLIVLLAVYFYSEYVQETKLFDLLMELFRVQLFFQLWLSYSSLVHLVHAEVEINCVTKPILLVIFFWPIHR